MVNESIRYVLAATGEPTNLPEFFPGLFFGFFFQSLKLVTQTLLMGLSGFLQGKTASWLFLKDCFRKIKNLLVPEIEGLNFFYTGCRKKIFAQSARWQSLSYWYREWEPSRRNKASEREIDLAFRGPWEERSPGSNADWRCKLMGRVLDEGNALFYFGEFSSRVFQVTLNAAFFLS